MRLLNKYVQTAVAVVCCMGLAACAGETAPDKPWEGKENLKAAGYNVRLSALYLEEGKVEIAKRKILLALEQAPNWPPAVDGMAYFYASTGRPKLAEEYYQRAIQVAGESGDVENNYGVFLCQTKRYEDAIKRFQLAVKDKNYVNVAQAFENAGVCAAKIPDVPRALRYFKKAIENAPTYASAYLHAANIYYQVKQYRNAQRYLKQFLAFNNQEQTEESLALQIRLAKQAGNADKVASDMLLLKHKFPRSAALVALLADEST